MAKRRRTNDGLPPYTRRRTYGVIHTPYQGRENGRSKWGKDINLGPQDMAVADVWDAYRREIKTDNDTLRWLLGEFHKSSKFKGLSPRTKKDYTDYRNILVKYPMASGKSFGSAPLDKIKRTSIQRFIDKYHAPIAANRLIQYLKSAWNWGLNRFDHIPENPCIGVDLNKQTPRDRYVTQEEFAAFKAATKGYIPLFMELAYLCRARWNEVASLQATDLLNEGVRLDRGKGSEGEITAWNPRLRAVVKAAKAFNSDAPSPISGSYLIHTKTGAAIKRNAFQSAWGRAQRQWQASGKERFTFHDLKAAGYSDQKKQDAGHKSDKMHRTYSRKLRIVEPAE